MLNEISTKFPETFFDGEEHMDSIITIKRDGDTYDVFIGPAGSDETHMFTKGEFEDIVLFVTNAKQLLQDE